MSGQRSRALGVGVFIRLFFILRHSGLLVLYRFTGCVWIYFRISLFFLKIFIYSFDISLSLFHSVIQLLRIVSFHSVLFGSQSVIFVRG